MDAHGSIETIETWFAGVERVLVLGRGPSVRDPRVLRRAADAAMVVDPTYALRDVYDGRPHAVLIGDESIVLGAVARRYRDEPPTHRPLLMHAYLPGTPHHRGDFEALGLPAPAPILPLLRRRGLYEHRPGRPYPTSGVFLAMVAAALDKPTCVAGIDLYRHPSGRMYVHRKLEEGHVIWPNKHSEAVDIEHLRLVVARLGPRLECVGVAAEVVAPSARYFNGGSASPSSGYGGNSSAGAAST